MSVADKIKELRNARAEINSAIANKGGEITATDGFTKFAAGIASIPQEIPEDEVTYDGVMDYGGLQQLGWTTDEIAYFKYDGGVVWSLNDSSKYAVTTPEKKEGIGKNTRWLDKSVAKEITDLKGYRRLIGMPPINADLFLENTPGFFKGCENLVLARTVSTVGHTDVSDLFYDCKSLRQTPSLDFTHAVTAIGTFYNCMSLKKINAEAVCVSLQDATAMFMGCKMLRTVPNLFSYTPSLVKTTSMFNGCSSLEYVPEIKMQDVKNAARMFAGCSHLLSIGGLTNFSPSTIDGMFDGCNTIKYLPDMNTYLATSLCQVFRNCSSLLSLPTGLTTDNVDDMTESFAGCTSLLAIPALYAGKYNNITGMLDNCIMLKDVGGFTNLGAAYDIKAAEDDPKYRLDLGDCTNLSLESLINIFNGLYDIKTKGVATQCIELTAEQKALMQSTEEGAACLEKAVTYGWNWDKY